MSDEAMFNIYRIYNISDDQLNFETRQGFGVSLLPGAASDLFLFELEGSKSFAKIDDPKKIWKFVGQSLSVSSDSESVGELQNELVELRGIVDSQERHAEVEVETAVTTESTGKTKKAKVIKKRRKKKGDVEA